MNDSLEPYRPLLLELARCSPELFLDPTTTEIGPCPACAVGGELHRAAGADLNPFSQESIACWLWSERRKAPTSLRDACRLAIRRQLVTAILKPTEGIDYDFVTF